MGAYVRINWIHNKISVFQYPNAKTVVEQFEIRKEWKSTCHPIILSDSIDCNGN
ncbi:hypothetical protein PAECIP111802_02301 [Paenibacillus allorhizosphaerae]|uniref:Uncharacterized protein n=1 Tax=Paenibacillus allorhizosphaerae TaxID=2849866 RepID=A0ABM8VG36_9BACL|nr:hypothetical protein PAECIP111802_02301 [Paenibacillus allorhizosphaerae]